MDRLIGRRKRSLRLRCCSCLVILALILLLLCVLSALGIQSVRKAHAQADSACAPDAVLVQTRVMQLTSAIPEPLSSATARGIFFQHQTVVTATGQERICLSSSPDGLSDLRVDDRLEIAVRHPDGGTATWQHDFADPRTGGITSLPPQDVSTLFAAGPNLVRVTLRDTRPPVYSASPVWLIMSQSMTVSPTPLPLLSTVSPTPTSLSLTPSETPEAPITPTSTAALPTPVAASVTDPRPFVRVWLAAIPIGVIILAVSMGLVMRARPKAAPRAVAAFGDQGTLEVSDPKTGEAQPFELRELALGEVWGIGNSPQCKIKVGRDPGDQELGVLVMTPDGPVVKSRGAPMWFEDEQVKEHRLFDGDDVYLGQFLLTYRNFFRRRGLDDEEEEEWDTGTG